MIIRKVEMKIEETMNNNIGIISISGNLVMDGTTELKSRIKPYIDNPNCKGLICNLAGVHHIDSAGIGVIVSIYKSLKKNDKGFSISGLNAKNRELFNLSRLDRVVNLAENDEAALQALPG